MKNVENSTENEDYYCVAHRIVNVFSKTINIVLAVILFILFIIGLYALWDAKLVAKQASSEALKTYKPSSSNKISFEELQSINPDTKAWLTLLDTGVDYPVMYSSDHSYYVFHDCFKNNSSSGSIFIDANCSPDFSDFNTIIYGHHMNDHVMFGDVPDYKDREYFDSHEFGQLFYGGEWHGLQVVGYLQTDVYNSSVYRYNINSAYDKMSYLSYLQGVSTQWRSVDVTENSHILLLSTCTGASMVERDVLVCTILDTPVFVDATDASINYGFDIDLLSGAFAFPWLIWTFVIIILLILLIIILLLISNYLKNKKRKNLK